MTIDARGKNCPIPVIMANKEIEKNVLSFTILVDNAIAVENLKKLAQNKGYGVEIKGVDSDYSVDFIGNESSFHGNTSALSDLFPETNISTPTDDWVLFMGKDIIGAGDPVLGGNLIKMYFYTLSQGTSLPKAILFMNAGVKLPTTNDQVIEHLKVLAEKGCEILVCGACLDFYQLTDQLQVGTISNMYDITEKINGASKVVTL
ncbi:sulfurtransferase-like selenium metabolism protein YedF [Acetobacterium paludosum]|uniref:Sulfurtransferase-like selenium metabolism protein YedF n=1 Tax=Acetobacterium paludosum TaxID=52693 RepID=A0A923KSA3_9FIRM|nr:sulfurtransferase-like selenium metabolism protein YedF [Acetobacterium paludosum]MBC3888157.1 sulfurtransferase-like selenium metabolism protein YedF [Acetobacterium paludosum]